MRFSSYTPFYFYMYLLLLFEIASLFTKNHLLFAQGPQAICINAYIQMLSSLSSLSPPELLFFIFLWSKKKSVKISLPEKPKHRQYPSSITVSHFTVLCELTKNKRVSVLVCACVQTGTCRHKCVGFDLSILFVSAMQVQKNSEAFSFFCSLKE